MANNVKQKTQSRKRTKRVYKRTKEDKIEALKDMKLDGNLLLGELLLTPHANKVNTNRGVLWCSHLPQIPVLRNNPEPPLMFTSFENQVGKYSSGYHLSKEPFKVIRKFFRNDYNYYTLIRYKYSRMYDIISREEVKWLTEKYGYQWENFLDDMNAGDKVDEQMLLNANTSYDDNMNFCFGKNLLAVYYADEDLTHEDAIVISDSVTGLTHTSVIPVTITINTNNLLLNMYGNKKKYKCFPDIGEYVKNNQLLTRRIINYDKILTDLRDLKTYREGDEVIYVDGKVVDIKVFCNANPEKFENIPYYEQILKYIKKERRYTESAIEFLYPIVTKEKDLCSDELILYYNELKMSVDNNKYTIKDNMFDNIVIQFLIEKENKLKIGDKLTGRYGNSNLLIR